MIAPPSTRRGFAALVLGIVCAALPGVQAVAQTPASAPPPPSAEHPVERMRLPRLVRMTPPDFPEAARRAGIAKAIVFVHFLIDRNGRVRRPLALLCTHAGLGFEKAAVQAVKRWRYEPGELDGKRIESYRSVQVPFDATASPAPLAVVLSPPITHISPAK